MFVQLHLTISSSRRRKAKENSGAVLTATWLYTHARELHHPHTHTRVHTCGVKDSSRGFSVQFPVLSRSQCRTPSRSGRTEEVRLLEHHGMLRSMYAGGGAERISLGTSRVRGER